MKELIGRTVKLPTGNDVFKFLEAKIIKDLKNGLMMAEFKNGYKFPFEIEYLQEHLEERPKQIKVYLGSTYSPDYEKKLSDKKEEMKALGYKFEREDEHGRDFESEITFRLIEDWEKQKSE